MSTSTDLPVNKIGDSTGESTTWLWFFIGHFLIAYLLQSIYVSESVGDPIRLTGFKSFLRTFVFFQNFLFYGMVLHCTLLVVCGNLPFMHPSGLLQCRISMTCMTIDPWKSLIYVLHYTVCSQRRLKTLLDWVLTSTIAQFLCQSAGKKNFTSSWMLLFVSTWCWLILEIEHLSFNLFRSIFWSTRK